MKGILLTNEAVLSIKKRLRLAAITQTTGGHVTLWKEVDSYEYQSPEDFAEKVLEEMKIYRPALLKVQTAQMDKVPHNLVVVQILEIQEGWLVFDTTEKKFYGPHWSKEDADKEASGLVGTGSDVVVIRESERSQV